MVSEAEAIVAFVHKTKICWLVYASEICHNMLLPNIDQQCALHTQQQHKFQFYLTGRNSYM